IAKAVELAKAEEVAKAVAAVKAAESAKKAEEPSQLLDIDEVEVLDEDLDDEDLDDEDLDDEDLLDNELLAEEDESEEEIAALEEDLEELEEEEEEEDLEELEARQPYQTPSMELLSEPEPQDPDLHKAEIEEKSKLIEECLSEFRIEAKVEHVERGPNVTLYALALGKGIKVQRISALLDNLALVLASPGAIRMQAPIRGTSWVGLEVPNERQEMVTFAEIYRQPEWRDKEIALPLFLGKDTAGRPLIADLTKLPHLLVAGATGSGKSVCINTMILSMLMTRSPSDVKMILIDPKQVELAPFGDIPHLLSPVVTDMSHAGAALDWAVQKMEERYNFLAKARVRHLKEYNKLGKEGLVKRMGLKNVEELERQKIPWKLPYIVVVVDELNDLMMVAQKEVEASIMRLAQKSRAIGIHVILATQRPSVDVITGVIKSNLPARLAFQVTSKVDSRTILDVMGAEKLLGMGDMLFLAPGRSQPSRAKGAYVSEEELERVLETICHQRRPNYAQDLVELKNAPPKEDPKKKKKKRRKTQREDGSDELFDDAVEVVLGSGRGSVSLLQRKLGIGYARAARIIESMSDQGILGSDRGSKARKVLMSMVEWKNSL
ncbi:MAG: DNA translocase FtsK, partial [Planctomycetota bacterium]|nr:DNA translocase FtsK [Planctomycetota bacterium]